MEKTKHENVCDKYRQALEQQFIQSNSPRPIMILAVKAKNDEIRYEAEDNDVDVVKDIKYCPFCDKNGNIATIHPKPDELHLPSNTGNWCPAFFTSLMIFTLYFSKRQIQSLSIDVETKVLNDLGEKVHRMGDMIIERPELGKVITDIQADRWSVELPFVYYVLYICSHAYDMRERRVLNDNEWAGWLQWMKNCFQQGTIKEHWRRIESEKWFDPSFQNFINQEVLAAS